MLVTTSPGARVWKALAATTLTVAALVGLGYAGWLITARRAIFVAIAERAAGHAGEPAGEPGGVALAVARHSDAVNTAWLWAASVLLVVSMLVWVAARTVVHTRSGLVGFAGLCLLVAGLVVATGGSFLASVAGDDASTADRIATGYCVIGAGFALTSLGLLAGAVALVRGPPAEPGLGYAGWSG